MDDIVKGGLSAALDGPVPTHVKVIDEWGKLESRVRFYCAGAESIARDWIDAAQMDPMVRGADDLIDHVMEFEELLKAYVGSVQPNAKKEPGQ